MNILSSIGSMFVGSSVTINGRTITAGPGQVISCSNGVIMIDGAPIGDAKFQKDMAIAKKIDITINIPDKTADRVTLRVENANSATVKGNVGSLSSTNASISVEGTTGSVRTTNGGVHIRAGVTGSVDTTNGSIHVGGSVGGGAHSVNGSVHSN